MAPSRLDKGFRRGGRGRECPCVSVFDRVFHEQGVETPQGAEVSAQVNRDYGKHHAAIAIRFFAHDLAANIILVETKAILWKLRLK